MEKASSRIEPFMSMEEVAAFLRLSTRTVWSKAKIGVIPAYRIPGIDRLLFRRDEIEKLLVRNVEMASDRVIAGLSEACN